MVRAQSSPQALEKPASAMRSKWMGDEGHGGLDQLAKSTTSMRMKHTGIHSKASVATGAPVNTSDSTHGIDTLGFTLFTTVPYVISGVSLQCMV